MNATKATAKGWKQVLWSLAEAESIIVRNDEEIADLNHALDNHEKALAPVLKGLRWV